MEQSAFETRTKTGIEDAVWDCGRVVTSTADMVVLVAMWVFAIGGCVPAIPGELENSQTVHPP
jgi:hypothetical protein